MTARLQSAAAGASLALCLLAGFAFAHNDDRMAMVFAAFGFAPLVLFVAVKP